MTAMRLPEHPEYIANAHDGPAGEPPGWGPRAALALLAGTVVLGISVMAAGTGQQAPPPQPGDARRAAGAAAPGGAAGAAAPLRPAVPTWVSIPAIDVEAPLMNVGLDPEGWVDAPPQEIANLAGWYQDGAAPGARGTAVIVGHVDNASGPAVFYGLGVLRPGDAVEVIREDGVAVRFTVYDVAVYDKDEVPPSVYHDTGQPELRVITCGGSFEQDSGYEDNVVVYARMTDAG
ncbi:class F sortase [Streptomyces marincola]|nr:class F sortase [Streptomyces marincola]UCM86482.1 class F sortase [Streptomyces marincola]